LLNALCGRAFYGETTGTIRINGHVTSIEEHKSSTGFVPQDDIVHAELTVRENLLYSGRFTLPAGTKFEAIEELADRVLAQLGLSRVADSLVGDVNRRGVSGGEKVRNCPSFTLIVDRVFKSLTSLFCIQETRQYRSVEAERNYGCKATGVFKKSNTVPCTKVWS
jgi:ABC-type uncharacterized transport system YnjBCD ATPase subunit